MLICNQYKYKQVLVQQLNHNKTALNNKNKEELMM